MARASDFDIARLFRQTSALTRLVDEGKRDPKWVSDVLQVAIEHREDGRLDFVADMEKVDLGNVQVDYSTPLAAQTGTIKTYASYLEGFEQLPKPMHYGSGTRERHLVLTRYTFNDFRCKMDATYHDIRRLQEEERLVPVNLWELLAVHHQQLEILNNLKVRKLVALGIGIPSAGTTGDIHCIFEHIPCLERFLLNEEFELRTEHANAGRADKEAWYLACKRPS